ncbi:hypothetical protein CapIbe_012679 [Capra ibex]
MSASLPATIALARKVKILPLRSIPGTWTFVLLFGSALQNSVCLSGENPPDCGDQMPCAEEPDPPGCPEGGLCPDSPPAPCPPGTFFSGASPHNASFCHLCPRGFFNPWPGQDACFPCGSEATQLEEGKDTCVCPGSGRVFQPSDGQCPCLPGYQDVGEPKGCVQREYKTCKHGATRNQEGLCLTKDQWNEHCAHEVCAAPEDAHGYDPGLGLCLCWGPHSNEMCGPLCPKRQGQVLQLSCPEGNPQISITENTGSQGFFLPDGPSSPRAVGHPCHLDQRQHPVSLYVVRVDGIGFLGLARPGRELLRSLGQPLGDLGLPGQEAGKAGDAHLSSPSSLSLNSSHPGNESSPEVGIRNPTVCLQTRDTLAFLVTREHYPEYDRGHFYNTPGQFDWGRFRALAEESQLHDQSPHIFLQQFQEPGVYVFRLNSNWHRKMYVRTLPPGGQCFGEGPFVPTTPRYLIQTGIAKIPRPLKRSNWPGVLGEIVLLLGLCLLLLIQCHSLSWARKAAPQPIFRKHQQGYNLDAYTSPRLKITSVRRGRPRQDSDDPGVKGGHGGSWEAKDQVDLEGFDTETFFRILLRQSLSVTTKLSQTKEELKRLCLQLGSEARSLQQLWGPEHRIAASAGQLLGSPQRERQQAAEAAARAAEEEARRRGRLAGEYAACLGHQLVLLRQDLRARQEQWGSFCSALMASRRLLKAHSGSRPAKSSQAGQNPEGEVPQLDALLGSLSQVVLQEGHRLKAWGVLGTGTGAELLRPASASPPGDPKNIGVHPVTKMMVPGPDCVMLPASGQAGPIPPGYFIHPDTGRVLPEAGNLGYDVQEATLVPTTDCSSGGIRTSEAAILPYVPYPTCLATGSLPATHLPVLQPRRTSQSGALMTDPITGIEVPVLAVTLHPQTRQWLTLGGTYRNPLTQTLAPLELGGPMEDPVTGGISPILGVGLDENTGQVLALGGLRDASGNLLLPGDSFVEPLSRKPVWLQGASQLEGHTVPHTGGPQGLLDANVLAAQRRVIAVLRSSQERPGPRAQGLLEAAVKDMRQALALSLHHLLQQARWLQRQQEAAESLEASGGRIGVMRYPGTVLWVPALYGMEIPDPEGSGLMVPILGMESDGDAGHATPVAGSMEDADGKGLVPIAIGAQAIDPLTGEPGPVIGAQADPSTGVVVPIVQVLEALPRGVRDPGLLDTLEKERRAREQYWRCQEQEEVRLVEQLGAVSRGLLSTPCEDPGLRLRATEEACAAMEARCLQETQRRARALSGLGGQRERDLLAQADREEWEQEAKVMLGLQQVLQSLGQAAEKLRQAVGRLRGQEEEMRLQGSRDQCPQVWSRSRKVVQHLSDELQEVVRERQSALDRALGQLQYQRELSRLQLSHIQIVASGTPVCLENYPGDRFYGTVTTSPRDQAAACPLLIPFLKSLTAALVGNQGHGLGPEDGGPGTALKSSLQDLSKPQITQKEELITVPCTDLSAREFVVYQHGLSILHLLIPQLQAPKITLQIASRLPTMEASDNAFQGSFFYQYIKKNKDLLLFINMEHFLKSILAAEQKLPKETRDQLGDEEKVRCSDDLQR